MVGGTGRYWENQGCCGCRVLGGTGALGASGRGVWAEQRALKSAGYWEALGGMGGSGVGGCMEGGPRGSGWGLRECQGPAPLPVMSSAPNGGASLGRSGGGTWVLRVVAVGAGDQTRGLGGVKCHQPPRGRGAEPLPPRPPPHPLSASWGPTGSGCWGVPGPLDTLGVGVPPPCWVPRAPPRLQRVPPRLRCLRPLRPIFLPLHRGPEKVPSVGRCSALRRGGTGQRGPPCAALCPDTRLCPPQTHGCAPPPQHVPWSTPGRACSHGTAWRAQPHSHSHTHTQLTLTHSCSQVHTHTRLTLSWHSLTLSSRTHTHTFTLTHSHSAHTHSHTRSHTHTHTQLTLTLTLTPAPEPRPSVPSPHRQLLDKDTFSKSDPRE